MYLKMSYQHLPKVHRPGAYKTAASANNKILKMQPWYNLVSDPSDFQAVQPNLLKRKPR